MNASPADDDGLEAAPLEARVGDWLDDAKDVTDESLLPAERRRAADLQFLHGVLQQGLRRDAVARERRILRSMSAIDQDVRLYQDSTAPRRRRWLSPLVVTAAVLVMAVILRGPVNPRLSAVGAVAETLREAEQDVDRRYVLEIRQPMSQGEPRTFSADLWVRGGTKFLFRQDGALGDFFVGSNGEEDWVAPAVGPVLVGADAGLLQQWMGGERLPLPFLQVTSILQRLSDRYDLTLAAEVDVPAVDGGKTVRCTHVTGKKRSDDDSLAPDQIDLWTGRQSGVAYRLLLHWKDRGSLGGRDADTPAEASPLEVEWRLKSLDEEVPEDWYDHSAHHATDRVIIPRSAGNQNEP